MTFFSKTNSPNLLKDSLPHNFLAEKMLLSCLLWNPEALEITREHLVIEAFYFKNHQEFYRALLEMRDRQSLIDLVTVTVFLQDNGQLSKIGGMKVLLSIGNQSLTFSYLPEYIRIVKEKFLKRSLIKFGYKIVNSGYVTNISFETSLLKIERDFVQLLNEIPAKSTITTAELLNQLFSDLKNKFLNPQLPGISSGFPKLDELTQGFQKSDLVIIAGRPSMGKTALSLNIALNCIKLCRLPVLFCSLEMSKEQILYRLLSSESGINQMKLKSGNLTSNDWIKLNKVIRILSKLPFFMDDTSNVSIPEIRSKIKKILLEQSQLGLVIVDYLQLLQDLNSKSINRVQELSKITRELKGLAREFNIPILALSQLSRNADNRIDQRPILSDLRESGSIEQDADLILMLHSLKINSTSNLIVSNKLPITELIIAKHRNGPTGSLKLEFHKDRIKFLESSFLD